MKSALLLQPKSQIKLLNLPATSRQVQRDHLPLGLALTHYSNEVAELLHEFKTSGNRRIIKWMASQMANPLKDLTANRKSVLIPIPSNPSATRARGFVPAAELAKQLVKLTPNLIWHDGLWLQRQTADQAGLTLEQRQENLSGAMRAKPSVRKLHSFQVILLDDVITTGSSMREAARALRVEGIEINFLFAFAETLRKSQRDV